MQWLFFIVMFCLVGNFEQQCFAAAGPQVTSESVCVWPLCLQWQTFQQMWLDKLTKSWPLQNLSCWKGKASPECYWTVGSYEHWAKPSDILVHPSNRSGQGLAHWDVWREGRNLWSVGVRKQLYWLLPMPLSFQCTLQLGQATLMPMPSLLIIVVGYLPHSMERNGFWLFHSVIQVHGSKPWTVDWLALPNFNCNWKLGTLKVTLSMTCCRMDGNGWYSPHWWRSNGKRCQPSWRWLWMPAMPTGNKCQKWNVLLHWQRHWDMATTRQAMHPVAMCDPACKSSLKDICEYVCKFGGANGMPIVKALSKFSVLNPFVCNFSCAWEGCDIVPQLGPVYSSGKAYVTVMVRTWELKNETNMLPFLRAAMCLNQNKCKLFFPLVQAFMALDERYAGMFAIASPAITGGAQWWPLWSVRMASPRFWTEVTQRSARSRPFATKSWKQSHLDGSSTCGVECTVSLCVLAFSLLGLFECCCFFAPHPTTMQGTATWFLGIAWRGNGSSPNCVFWKTVLQSVLAFAG